MRGRAHIRTAVTALALVAVPSVARAQGTLPLGYVTARGSTVTPVYEGWYPNPDGTITLSWGFYNRNSEEQLDIPFGPDNSIEPAAFDGPQPTHFDGGRAWGAFGVIIPSDYSGDPVEWTLKIRGGTFSVPANRTAEWRIDARAGDAQGNLPPELAFSQAGPWFVGPGGEYSDATARAGQPTRLTLWARDDGAEEEGGGGGRGGRGGRTPSVNLTWLEHSGPGHVTFEHDPTSARIPATGGSMTTEATFSRPGQYVVRVRVNDASGVTGAGHAQCCWSNAFFRVTVASQ